ncbi:MAG: sugar-binding transcriptional regulator [Lachnospiraceae bacterium]|nr:sugar-binding transcriptional regulator [Lachnospiraceae bacterium]
MFDAATDYEKNLMIKIAWYYYMENMTQQAIADQLGITRMRVIKLLEKARQSGVVQFRISSSFDTRRELETRLMEKYHLRDCYTVPTNPNSADTNDTIAKAASIYIANHVRENSYINFGYGDTTSRTIEYLSKNLETAVSFVSLTGGVGYYLPKSESNIFNAKLYLIPSPIIMSSAQMADAIKQERSVQEVTDMISLASMTVVGIGGMDDSATIVKSSILAPSDFRLLAMKGAVGDVICHFIDQNGNLIDTAVDSRLVSVPLGKLKELENVIGVAAGKHKLAAIHAALMGGYLDILITDEETAERLCRDESKHSE